MTTDELPQFAFIGGISTLCPWCDHKINMHDMQRLGCWEESNGSDRCQCHKAPSDIAFELIARARLEGLVRGMHFAGKMQA